MALSLTKETGAGLTNANSYADLADGNLYHEASLYAPEWNIATPDRRVMALISATRMLDGEMQFNGFKRNQEQSLQWPRRLCPDPDSDAFTAWFTYGGAYGNPVYTGSYLPEAAVPKPVIDATSELAGRLLQSNRAADPREASIGAGVKSFTLEGAISVDFNTTAATDVFVTPTLPRDVANLLAKYGRVMGGGGTARLIRA